MNARIVQVLYGYIVCLCALALFAYGLGTINTQNETLRRAFAPVEVSIIETDTMATDVNPLGTFGAR
jgi:hypothetical protein